MKTPQQIKNEVEKGCGKHYPVGLGIAYFCNKEHLCPSCLAKLSILTEYDKARNKEELEFYKCLDKKNSEFGNMELVDKMIKFKIKELLSKMGDNSGLDKCFKGECDCLSQEEIGDNSEVEK